MQIRLCMTRGFQRMMGDKTFVVATVLANLVISLVLGSIYYKLDPVAESMNSRCVLIYFAIVFNALSSALEVMPPTPSALTRVLEPNINDFRYSPSTRNGLL